MVQQLRPRRRDGRFRSESENELEGDNKNYDDNDFDRIDDILHVQLNKYISAQFTVQQQVGWMWWAQTRRIRTTRQFIMIDESRDGKNERESE